MRRQTAGGKRRPTWEEKTGLKKEEGKRGTKYMKKAVKQVRILNQRREEETDNE